MALQYVEGLADKQTKTVGEQLISTIYANDGQDMSTTVPWRLGKSIIQAVRVNWDQDGTMDKPCISTLIKEWHEGSSQFPRLVILVRSRLKNNFI